MEKKIKIDNFEFEGRYSDVPDVENLNYFLESKFNKFDIKDYMSRRHPEIFPKHIGLWSNDNLRLKIVRWEKGGLDFCGEYDNSWRCFTEPNPEKYRDDILTFYKDKDLPFYNFIKDKIQ